MYDKLLAHIEEIASGDSWKENGFIPLQEFNETYQEIEKGIVNFHRTVFEKSKPVQFKVTCKLAGGVLLPSEQIVNYFTNHVKSQL